MLGLYLRTARYYRASQIAARLRLGVDSLIVRKSPWLRHHRYALEAVPAIDNRAVFFSNERESDSWSKCGRAVEAWAEAASLCREGKFKLLNRVVNVGSAVNWDPPETTRLWRYNLHYFDYALDLALLAKSINDPISAALLARLFHQWIEANPLGEGIGWHSYPIARRIVNWIKAVKLVSTDAVFEAQHSKGEWLKSLFQQTRYLEDRLELDCLGNHLLADAKALFFAGVFFGGDVGSNWITLGEELLWSGLREQIMEDGGHYERSPMYHAIVLQDYLEIVLTMQLNGKEVPPWVRERLVSMADFLSVMVHPDREIPLFGDSAFGIAHSPGDILAAAEVLLECEGRWPAAMPSTYCVFMAPKAFSRSDRNFRAKPKLLELPTSGYFVVTGAQPDSQMIIDAKPMGPDHVPAHGHCSLFSYEFSLGGERVVVDSGVEEYEPGPWREFWRSTRAHNALVVDGCEQSEIWASFRVGRRANVLDVNCQYGNGSALFVGTHDGFAKSSNPVLHRRFIASLDWDLWMVLDEVVGRGQHTLESLVHLNPEATCLVGDRYADIVIRKLRLRIYPYSAGPSRIECFRGEMDPIQGWYAPEFGKRQANSVVSLFREATLPARVGYVIAPVDCGIESWELQDSDLGDTIQTDISVLTIKGQVSKSFERSKYRSTTSEIH